MQVVEAEKKNFLGQEFLTWLWYYGEKHEGTLEISKEEQVNYEIEKEKGLLVLEPVSTDDSCIQRLQGANSSTCAEATEGLKSGKKVALVKMWLKYQDCEWTFTCRGEKLAVSSLVLGNPNSSVSDERFYELVEKLEKFVMVWDKMFAVFLKIRLSSDWQKKELPSISTWIQEREEKES